MNDPSLTGPGTRPPPPYWQKSLALQWLLLVLALSAGAVPASVQGGDRRLDETSPLKADEEVLLFPAYAFQDIRTGRWNVRFWGVVYEPEQESLSRAALVALARRTLGIRSGSQDAARLEERLRSFLVDHERGKRVTVQAGRAVVTCGPTEADGHFRGVATVEDADAAFPREVTVTAPDGRVFRAPVLRIPPRGVAIISDIDDTIKITDVLDRREAFFNTFIRPMQPVPGMAGQYRRMAAEGAVFHYVSNSPWQLFHTLWPFLKNAGYPEGTIHLRPFRLTEATLFDFAHTQTEFKLHTIQQLLADFPRRHFILIGDVGQRDPEVYGQIARQHPDQILAVWLRRVRHGGDETLRPRLAEAFHGVPDARWLLFDQPQDLEPAWARVRP